LFLCGLAVLLLNGCARVISQPVLQQVDETLTYRTLAADPQAYVGKMVLLGGTIVQAVPRTGETEIEVVQKDLDSSGEPRLTDDSAGRFLVVVDRFLDPAIYKAGRDLTVAGRVTGALVRRIGEIDYRYPVVAAMELHLCRPWQPLSPAITPYPYRRWWLYPDSPYGWW
jgi:outer membrane lipoprotein